MVHKLILFLTFALCGQDLALSKQEVRLGEELKKLELAGNYLEILEDQTGSLTLADIRSNSELNWTHPEGSPKYWNQDFFVWVRMVIAPVSGGRRDWTLEIPWPFLEQLDVYQIQANEVISQYRTGTKLPFHTRPIDFNYYAFPLEVSGDLPTEIYLRVHYPSDLRIPVTIWKNQNFLEHQIRVQAYFGIYMGIMIAMILYNMMLYLKLKDPNLVSYILFIATFALMQAVLLGLAFQHLWPNLPGFGQISYFITSASTSFFVLMFSRKFLKTKFYAPKMDKALFGLQAYAFGTFLLGFINHYQANFYASITGLIGPPILLGTAILTYLRGYKPARLYIIGFTTFLTGVTYNLLGSFSIVEESFLTQFGMPIGSAIEVLLTSLALGDRIKIEQDEQNATIQKLNDTLIREEQEKRKAKEQAIKLQQEHIITLDHLVERKSQQIKSIMKHIKQGIFTIATSDQNDDAEVELEGDFYIEGYYSGFLEDILGMTNLYGRDPLKILAEKTNLTQDEIARVRSSLFAALGSDPMNFDINIDNFPREVELDDKIIAINWQAISNEDDLTEKIMVVARDVTEVRQLELQTKEHKIQMEKIEEIIAVPMDRCQDFFIQCQKFLEENQRLIQSNQELSRSTLQIIFINYHTLKGNARSLAFKYIGEAIHLAEDRCQRIRNGDESWDQTALMRDHHSVQKTLNQYVELSSGKLGRIMKKGKFFDIEALQECVELIKALSPTAKVKHRKLIDSVYASYYKNSHDFFSEVFSQTNRLSKDLKKPVPHINVVGDPVLFTTDAASVLNNVFTHLIRNSMDHGLETENERIVQQKPAQGTITVTLTDLGSQLKIGFKDDGRGLDLTKIKALGIARDLISEDERDLDKIAHLIFAHSVSTAEDVTEISGRGVGLDAVKAYMDHLGKLDLTLLDIQDESNRASFEFELYLPDTCLYRLDEESSQSLAS
ncbi:7TM diverse intracellular signaling domain-containing protein [Pseudobacteriovorax antillogorgiicola]|uniref:Hpt domain-containing protein n=1 Tax=Pseudobacteriovorax antillogorgiicola TaxID=1513793 RepID=A0A1Y6BW54_9BACT|nr:7TM diverse intracellular signaling domain-containing protein [Pseudobacteriovorax antillogorgiicola]TCS52272.1 Hpt domain-containing protein [Pseudobacteriovorax antillogorgiicola]SMF30845.1 Hpt domain-containing protein [Pseudobacteriovorax antillogorgiicola]